MSPKKVGRNYRRTPNLTSIHPVTQVQYTFRLERLRTNGRIRITMDPNSPALAGRHRDFLPSTRGYDDFTHAATTLLGMTMRNPVEHRRPLHQQHWVWNQNAHDRPDRQIHTDTCVQYLDRIFNPTAGRPLKHDVALARAAIATLSPNGVMKPNMYKARMNRRAEQLLLLNKFSLALHAYTDSRFADARVMRGYKAEEIKKLRELYADLHAALNNTLEWVRDHSNSAPPQTPDEDDTPTLDATPTQADPLGALLAQPIVNFDDFDVDDTSPSAPTPMPFGMQPPTE